MCSLSRYLLVALGFGMLASSLAGSDAVGWLVAGLAVLGLVALERRFPGRFGAGSCSVPAQGRAADAGEPVADPIPRRAERHSGVEVHR